MIPETRNALVLRTDFSDEAAWNSLCAAIVAPQTFRGLTFQAYVEFVSDSTYDGFSTENIIAALLDGPYRFFACVVDGVAISHPEHPILIIDLITERGRTFRVIPSQMWTVENNLSLCNMDFSEFVSSVDQDGIFRDFPKPEDDKLSD